MKAEILKISGHKNLKEFYKEFPDQEAFMKKHGGEFNKAQRGASIPMVQYDQYYDDADMQITGTNNDERLALLQKQQPSTQEDQPTNGLDDILGMAGEALSIYNGNGNIPTAQVGARLPANINTGLGTYNNDKDYYQGNNPYFMTNPGPINNYPSPDFTNNGNAPKEYSANPTASGFGGALESINPLGMIGNLAKGFSALKAEKKAKKVAYQSRDVSKVALQAANTVDVDTRRFEQDQRANQREDLMPINTGEEFFPIYGSGTNALARNGKSMKAQQGAAVNPAMPWDMVGNIGGMLGNYATGNNAGGQIGTELGGAAGMLIGGPLGSAVGKLAGSTIGGLLDKNPKRIKAANDITKQNIQGIAGVNAGKSIQNQYKSYLEYGGEVPDTDSEGLDGNLQTQWGGELESLSNNPYLPNSGETAMFKGDSHEEGGIGASYGGNFVEAEGGEPVVELEDSDGSTNAVIFGNLKISKDSARLIGDKKASNKKFKSYVADLSKQENKHMKTFDTNMSEFAELTPITSFDKLKANTLQIMMQGASMSLKDIAEKKNKASNVQNAINDTASEYNLDADKLAVGQYKKGKANELAEDGKKVTKEPGVDFNTKIKPYLETFNQVLPYLRNSNTEDLSLDQLQGEMFALSNNELEPVNARGYSPQLDVPYDTSLQDMRNENQATYNSAQRFTGYNPAAQATLAAQKYTADQKVGAEEFRMNQAMKSQTYNNNRAAMNDAQLKNLGIFDQQYTRQSQAKSNTKAVTQAALSSISDKVLKNKSENRKLQLYENMYNYRFDKNYRTINENPLALFDTELKSSTNPDAMTKEERIAQLKDEIDDFEAAKKAARKASRATAVKSRTGSMIQSLKSI